MKRPAEAPPLDGKKKKKMQKKKKKLKKKEYAALPKLAPDEAYAILRDADDAGRVFAMCSFSWTLGRCSPRHGCAEVDVGRGDARCSRMHARIDFNFTTRRFELRCFSKNGATVDGMYVGPGAPAVPLHSRSLVGIGRRLFHFLLPPGSAHRRIEERAQVAALIAEMQPAAAGGAAVPRPHAAAFAAHVARLQAAPGPAVAEHADADSEVAPIPPERVAVWSAFVPDDADEPWRTSPDVRPPYSFMSLLLQVFITTGCQPLTLPDVRPSGPYGAVAEMHAQIYAAIEARYPFFASSGVVGWKGSVRHTLSAFGFFVKIPRLLGGGEGPPVKSGFWALSPTLTDEMCQRSCAVQTKDFGHSAPTPL